MTARIVLQLFDEYQKARVTFVNSVAELASRPYNVEYLDQAGVLDLLRPLLSDVVPSIQQTAAVALGRLANNSVNIAEGIVKKDTILKLVDSLDSKNKYYKKSALFVLRAVSKHSPDMAQIVVQNGGLDAMILCLEDFDTSVKESAAWAIGYVSRHNQNLAQTVVDAGVVPLLVLCLQEPELCLKQISASALSDIGKHSSDLAQTLVDAGCISFLVKMLTNPDPKLKRQVLAALSCIAKHSTDLAELVVEGEIFPDVLIHMSHPDDCVKRNAALLVKEIAKHSRELSQIIVNIGGVGALLEVVSTTKGEIRLPGVMALGYIAAHSNQLAMSIIESNGVQELSKVLNEEAEEHQLAAVVWTIGQLGKHSSEHSKKVAEENIFPRILQLYNLPTSSEDLKIKCRSSLKMMLWKCLNICYLEPLLYEAPPEIVKYIVGQFSKILPNDPKARRNFVLTGGLKKVQEIQTEPGSTLMEYISIINCCFPEEIVRYYSPGYPNSLLDAVEQYQPQISMAYFHHSQDDIEEEEEDFDIIDHPIDIPVVP